MKTKEIVKLTIGYTDEFAFDDLGDAIFFLKLWNRGKVDEIVRATIEIVKVPISIEEHADVPTCSECDEGVDGCRA